MLQYEGVRTCRPRDDHVGSGTLNGETRFRRRFSQARDAEVICVSEERRAAGVRFQADELDIGGARVGEVGEALLVHESADATAGGSYTSFTGVKPGMKTWPLTTCPLVPLVRTS